jgi:hypothetical protein
VCRIGLIGEELVLVERSGLVPFAQGRPSRSDATMVAVGFNPRCYTQVGTDIDELGVLEDDEGLVKSRREAKLVKDDRTCLRLG